jgi:hypothetical protein
LTAAFTPTSSSWLNLVERWFSELTTKKLRRSAHRSVKDLNADIRHWITTWNDEPRPYVWTKTVDRTRGRGHRQARRRYRIADPATEPRSGQAQVVAEHVEQWRIRLTSDGALRAVHRQPDFRDHRS